jgi:hypothetical protein
VSDSYNAAERSDVKAATKRAKLETMQRGNVVRDVMSSTNGRQWMLSILEHCHVFAPSFTGEALTTAFAEGQREVGLFFTNDIMSFCPEQWVRMLQERNTRDASGRSAAELARRQDPGGDAEGSGIASPGDEDYGAGGRTDH